MGAGYIQLCYMYVFTSVGDIKQGLQHLSGSHYLEWMSKTTVCRTCRHEPYLWLNSASLYSRIRMDGFTDGRTDRQIVDRNTQVSVHVAWTSSSRKM